MTLLIKNVHILGGDRDFSDPVDVFINNGIISAIGTFPGKRADEVLDGQGAYLSPGFIDIDSASDHYLTLFSDRGQEDFLRQGVTTIIGGMGGASLAPLPYGTLEALQKWGDPGQINVNWHTLAELSTSLHERPLSINFGTLVGHATIRRALIGEAIRDLTKNELKVFQRTLKEAMDQGAFGISVGLSAVHTRGTPFAERAALALTVARAGGVYATDLLVDERGDFDASLDEAIQLSEVKDAKILLAHFAPVDGSEDRYRAALERINSLPESTAFRFSTHPFAHDLVPIYTLLPLWAQNGGIKVMQENVKDAWLVARIKHDIAELDEERCIVAYAPGNKVLVGKTLREIREMYGMQDVRDALLALMRATKLTASLLTHTLNAHLARKALAGPRSFLGSHAPSFRHGQEHLWIKPRAATSSFTTLLSLAAQGELSPLNIKSAVRKLTVEPAMFLGLKGRGMIKEGNHADLVCFKSAASPAAGSARGKKDSIEVRFTIVNGVIAVEDGVFKGLYEGNVLRRNA